MPKEKPTYRLEVEALKAMFPDKNILTKQEIMQYTGKKEYWLNHHGFKGKSSLTIVQVAAILTDMI